MATEEEQPLTTDDGWLMKPLRTERSTYKRSLGECGERAYEPEEATVNIDDMVRTELFFLQQRLPCETLNDAIEYLMTYWATEGGLEKDYDYYNSDDAYKLREMILDDHYLGRTEPLSGPRYQIYKGW